ncbi:MAG: hypothetical protein M3437_15880 [Chloroflexota bacterium]|nr:hypothetical protein [Chloroflexota bacterium]MDQ5867336.1 hypothetical protein [Chloroflexota bacterium]
MDTEGASSRAQELYLQLIGLVSVKTINGAQIERDLRAERDKWTGALVTSRSGPGYVLRFLVSREDGDSRYTADTLYVRLPLDNVGWLENKAREWGATEVKVYRHRELGEWIGTHSPELRTTGTHEGDVICGLWWW